MRQLRYHIRLFLQCILLFVAYFGGPILSEAVAAPLPEIEVMPSQRHTIAFIPGIPVYLYKDVPISVSIDTVRLHNEMIAHASAHPYLNVMSEVDIRRAFQSDTYTANEAYSQAEIDMGYAENLMSGMHFDSAISLLQRITQNYSKSLTNYLQPGAVARAYQMLAYAYIAKYQEDTENGNQFRHLAKLAFMEFIRLAPHIMMLEGRQSPDRVSIYDEALNLFLGSDSYRQIPQRDATALAHKLHADSVIWMRVVQSTSGELVLEIDHYNAQTRTISYDKLPLNRIQTIDNQTLAQSVSETATSFFSNLYACLDFKPFQSATDAAPPTHRFLLDIAATYTFYTKHPTSNLLHGAGANLNLAFMLNKNFFVRIGAEIVSLLPNDDHELYDSFRVYRFPFYFGISQSWKHIRPYLGVGMEFSFSSDYTITNSVICKTFGTNDIECDPGAVKTNREPYSLGIPFIIGLNAGIDPFYLTFETYLSATTYPVEANAFRHPFALRLGIQYRF